MFKKKLLIAVFLLSITILSTNAYALPQPPGTEVEFWSTVLVETNPWTHNLIGGDFDPVLECTEPLIVERARLLLSLDFTPEYIPAKDLYLFRARVKFGDTLLTKKIKFSYSSDDPVTNVLWRVRIPESLLGEIADKSVTIEIITKKGSLNDINFSTLRGTSHVAPEPISMLLVGVGIAGLPVAGRFRRFIKKG